MICTLCSISLTDRS